MHVSNGMDDSMRHSSLFKRYPQISCSKPCPVLQWACICPLIEVPRRPLHIYVCCLLDRVHTISRHWRSLKGVQHPDLFVSSTKLELSKVALLVNLTWTWWCSCVAFEIPARSGYGMLLYLPVAEKKQQRRKHSEVGKDQGPKTVVR